jgi:hypothetical protein
MGLLDSLLGAISPQPEVRVSKRLANFLEFGEWSTISDNGRRNPCVLVRNISGQAIGHSMLHYSAFTANGGKLTSLMVNLPYLESGESGELNLPFWMLSDDQWSRTSFVVVDIDEMYEEDEDDEEEYDEDSQAIMATANGLANKLFALSGWESGEDETGPVVMGLIEYKGGGGYPDLINSRQLKVTLYHGRKRQPVKKVNGFAQPFTLEPGQSVCARVDLSPLGKKTLSKLRASAVIVQFLDDTAVAKSGRREEVLWDHNGTVLGPFSPAQLKGFATAGLLHSTDRLSQDGKRTWTAAAQVPDLNPVIVPRWYFARQKQRLGPFSTAQLAQLATAGLLQPTDMVLKEGAARWVQAVTVSELSFPKPSA